MSRVLSFKRLGRFFTTRTGRAVVLGTLGGSLPSFIEFGNYAQAIEVSRQREDRIREIAGKLKIDPEFLLHPGPKKPGKLVTTIASLRSKLGLFSALAPTPTVQPTTDIAASIADVKNRYGLVAADTSMRQLADLVALSLAPAAFAGKHRGQIKSQAESVVRLLSKDLLPPLKAGLPGVAAGRDGHARSAISQLRTTVRNILNAPGALDDAALEATLAQVRSAITSTLSVKAATTRWTKDAYPVRDTSRLAPSRPLDTNSTPPSVSPSLAPARLGTLAKSTLTGAASPDVQAVAQSLATPAKIFAFTHDRIGWESYAGVLKGALGTLKEGAGNDWDQALLLSDMLSTIGYQTQLEWGKVTLPIAQAMNLVGTEDPQQAGNLLATAGFDAVLLTAGGAPVAVQLTHAWVRAYIPYAQNRGATNGTPDTWVRMDPSFKRYQYQPGIAINGHVAWNESEYLQTSSVRPPVDHYSDKIWAYLRASNIVCDNLSQVGKRGSIVQEAFPYVPATLTVKIDGATSLAPEPPAALFQTVALALSSTAAGSGSGGATNLVTYSRNLADLWGRKLSLTFPPATPEDVQIIEQYGGLYSTPAYLISLRPTFSVDDAVVAEGTPVAAGAALDLDLTFAQPNIPNDFTHHSVTAGETHTEVFDHGTPPDWLLTARTTRLNQLLAQPGASPDAILSERLYVAGLRYFQEVDLGVDFATSVRWQRAVKRTFEADLRQELRVSYNVVGSPIRLIPAERSIDASRLQVGVIPISNDPSNRVEALGLAGFQSSYLEASIWEETQSTQGISAVKALLLARIAGQTLQTATASNVDAVLTSANLPADVEAEIRGAVLQGRTATLATAPLTLNRWSGTGYVLKDPATGAATYPISGGLAGGSDTGAGTSGAGNPFGSESWTEGGLLRMLLSRLVALLGGRDRDAAFGMESTSAPSTTQSDPVNVSSGNMFRGISDFRIVSRGIPVTLNRTYNSRSTYDGPFGYGWTFNYGEMILTNADGSTTYRESDGTEHLFPRNPDGSFQSPSGKHIDLVRNASNSTMTFKDGMAQSFDAQGLLTRQTDLNGNSVTIARDAQGHVTTVTDASSRTVLTFTTTNGRITRVADHTGRAVVYGYSGSDLTSVTDTTGKTWTNQYEGASHNLVRLSDPLGNTQAFDYDADDRLFHHVDALGGEEFFHYDIANRQAVVTDKRGGDRYIQFDDNGRATLEADPAGNVVKATWDPGNNRTQVVDSRGSATAYEYDPKGNLIRQVSPDTGISSTTYDTNSRPLTSTDPLGVITTNTYDGKGNLLTSSRNVSGVVQTTAYTYDGNGQLLTTKDPSDRVTTMTWNSTGALLTRTDAADQTTTMTPDALGRMASIKDPGNNTTSIVYDARDRMTSLTDPYTNTTTLRYDDAGRRTQVITPRGVTTYSYDAEGRVLNVTDPLGNRTSTTYNLAGDVVSRTDPRGNTTRFEYNTIGRVTKMIDPNGGIVSYDYCASLGTFCDFTDANGNKIHQEFDTMGRVVSVADSLSHVKTTTYDKAGRKTRGVDARNNATSYGYDEAGRLLTVTEASGAVTTYGYDKNGNKTSQRDANGHTWTFRYDALNRLVEETDPLTRKNFYTYDALGNLKTKTDPKGQTLTYAYNIHRLTSITYPDAKAENFTYDALGRLKTMTSPPDALSTIPDNFSYTYDNLNRVLTVFSSRTNTTLTYTYDAAGNRKTMTTPKGTVSYTYDGKNRLTQITDPTFGAFGLQYDPMDRRTKLTSPNGTSTDYLYDNAYRLTALATKDTGGTVLDAWSYAYDAVGNRTSKTDMNGAAETYEYDQVYRLTQARYPDASSEAFTYDPVGNRLSRVDQTGNSVAYSYDAANQMLAIGSGTYTYDANGSLTQKANGLGVTNYTWDFKNRLKTISGADGSETNIHTADGRRTEVNSPAGVNAFRPVYDQIGNPILDYNGINQLQVYRLYGPGIDEPLAEWRASGAQKTFLHRDALGSITAATNETAQLTYRQTYKAFGERQYQNVVPGVTPTRLSYTGRENAVGDLMQYRSRYYSSDIGRFIGEDGFRGIDRSPATTHRYGYAHANPTRFTDPLGAAVWESTMLQVTYGAGIVTAGVIWWDCTSRPYYPGVPGLHVSAISIVQGISFDFNLSGGRGVINMKDPTVYPDPADEDGTDGPGAPPEIEAWNGDALVLSLGIPAFGFTAAQVCGWDGDPLDDDTRDLQLTGRSEVSLSGLFGPNWARGASLVYGQNIAF